jgi:hypothetical protein
MEVGKVTRRSGYGLCGIESIRKATLLRCAGHELSNPFSALMANSIRVKQAFTPNQPGEEPVWQFMLGSLGPDHQTNILGEMTSTDRRW